jgi:ABC-type transporter Mla MlaB component
MSRTSTCAFWEEQRLSSQDEEPKLRPGEIAEHAAQTRRVVIDLSGVEMIDAAGLGALISVALTAQASQCSVKLAAPGNLILSLAKTLADRRINSLQQYFQSLI